MRTDLESLGRFYSQQLESIGIVVPKTVEPETLLWLHRTGIARARRYAQKIAALAIGHSITPSIDLVREVGDFDHEVRMLALSGSSIFELALKAHFARHFETKYEPMDYLDEKVWIPRASTTTPAQLIRGIQSSAKRSPRTSKSVDSTPLHELMDRLPMGTVSLMFQMAPREIALDVSRELDLNSHQLAVSVTRSLTHLRNACAHNAILWQSPSVFSPKLARSINKNLFDSFGQHSYLPFFLALNHQVQVATGSDVVACSLQSVLDRSSFYRQGFAHRVA